MKRILNLLLILVFSMFLNACSSEYYELQKSPCAINIINLDSILKSK